VLVSRDGPHHNVLKIKPPMVFGKKDVDTFMGALKETMDVMVGERKSILE